MSNKTLSISAILTVSVLFGNTIFADDGHSEKTLYRMQAKDAHLIRHVTGPVEESIRAVPAIPVNSFGWPGQDIIAIKGHAKLEIDPLSDKRINRDQDLCLIPI